MVYGDTDSIMINTGVKDYTECMRIGESLKKEINKRYTYLQIDVDYVFKRMLLLKKKKYAALKVVSVVNGEVNTQREVKGIDLVRRDWSIITKTAGNQLLNYLFSDISRDDFRIKIGEYLTNLAQNMKEGKIPLEQYVITKSLTHSLRDYDSKNNANNPHVVVALRMQKAGQIMNISFVCCHVSPSPHAGDFIRYIICVSTDPNHPLPSKMLGDRAFSIPEIRSSNGALQVPPPVRFHRSRTWTGTFAINCSPRCRVWWRRWTTFRAPTSAAASVWSTRWRPPRSTPPRAPTSPASSSRAPSAPTTRRCMHAWTRFRCTVRRADVTSSSWACCR